MYSFILITKYIYYLDYVYKCSDLLHYNTFDTCKNV